MTRADVQAITKGMAEPIKEFVAQEIAKAMAPLKKQIEEQMTWKGTWTERTVYGVGSVVNDGGDMWVALLPSIGQRPGTDRDHWQLAVRKGKPGPPGRDAVATIHELRGTR